MRSLHARSISALGCSGRVAAAKIQQTVRTAAVIGRRPAVPRRRAARIVGAHVVIKQRPTLEDAARRRKPRLRLGLALAKLGLATFNCGSSRSALMMQGIPAGVTDHSAHRRLRSIQENCSTCWTRSSSAFRVLSPSFRSRMFRRSCRPSRQDCGQTESAN